jgi:CDP-glucose 4,6-dehydratase
LTSLWGEGASWKLDNRDHPHEANYLKLDCSKAKSRLNWRPRWNIEQALEKIVAWHRAYSSGKEMREFSLSQINEYDMSKTKLLG